MTAERTVEQKQYEGVLPEEDGVVLIARRRFLDEKNGIQSVWRGAMLETGSNALFTGLALYSSTQADTIVDAWQSAALVYVPQAYDLALGHYRKYQLDNCIKRYTHTGESREFDKVGLALRGAAPDYPKQAKSSLIAGAARDILHLLPGPRVFKNWKSPFSWGAAATLPYYAILNVIEAKNLASNVLKRNFKQASKNEQSQFKFGRNETRRNKRVVTIDASKSHTGEPIDAPANPHRLATNLNAIKWDMFLERGRILASGVGIYGVYHFLHELYPETADHIADALQNPNIESIALATTWALVMAMGAGAAQHFLEERPNIQAKLDSNQAKSAINNEAMILVWDAIATLKDKIKAYQDPGTEQDDIELLKDIVDAASDIDRSALDEETRAYVDALIESMHKQREPANDDREQPDLPGINHP